MNKDERAALALAERSMRTDPSRQAAWSLVLDLRRRLRDDAEALALCEEANALFPEFEVSPDQILRMIESRAARAVADTDAFPLDQARRRSGGVTTPRSSRSATPASTSSPTTSTRPSFSPSPGNARASLRRPWNFTAGSGPFSPRTRPGRAGLQSPTLSRGPCCWPAVAPNGSPTPAAACAVRARQRLTPEPGLSWSGVAGEFLQVHWQKLILCLAVLLIVVSSNVAASQLLGPRLWSPVGKCLLALVYTVMFAASCRPGEWPAAAGRILLLTTLIVVPANSMLVGQMRLG